MYTSNDIVSDDSRTMFGRCLTRRADKADSGSVRSLDLTAPLSHGSIRSLEPKTTLLHPLIMRRVQAVKTALLHSTRRRSLFEIPLIMRRARDV
ncbi:hypothetical protein J6590_103779 [Homalodisca vitripennis]|nr:hypothetical protein J6590_103779 [Homalodisca vitripennis]